MGVEGIVSQSTNEAGTGVITNPNGVHGAKNEAPLGESAPVDASPQPEAKKEDPISSKFQALAKREKAIVKKIQEQKAFEESIKAKEKALEEREAKLKEWESLNDPLEVLKRKGWSYQDVTNRVLNDNKPTPEEMVGGVKKELDDLKRLRDEEKKQALEQEKQRAEAQAKQAVQDFKENITEFCKGKSEDYEFINLYESYDLVFDTISQHFDKQVKECEELGEGTPKMLSVEEASGLVEKHLEELYYKGLESKKVKAKLQPPPKPTEKDAKPQGPSKTLANTVTASSQGQAVPAKTEQERIQRAIDAARRVSQSQK